jgi:hypothetical protein
MIEESPRLYRRHDVWRRISGVTAARYVCFELVGGAVFAVQNCDFFHIPVSEESARSLDRQSIELFIEADPMERSGSHPSLAAAIEAHDREFAHL